MFVDVCFTMDIFLNFFKLNENQREQNLDTYRINYIKGLFIMDCIAVLPGLVSGESNKYNFCKLARFVHWSRFFD